MNLLDYLILATLAISSVIGMYNGFVISVMNIVSFFISWIGAFMFYPLLSQYIFSSRLYQSVLYYTSGSSKITSIEERAIPVSTLNPAQIEEIINSVQLPTPFDKLVQSNLLHNSIKHAQSLGEYFDYSIANIIVNIFSFLVIFFAVRIIFLVLISLLKNLTDLPVLKQFDSLFGLALGFVRGILIVFILFAVIPIFLTLVPFDLITQYIDHSLLGRFFFEFNIFTNFVKGII